MSFESSQFQPESTSKPGPIDLSGSATEHSPSALNHSNPDHQSAAGKPGFFDVYEQAAEQVPSGISDFVQNIKRDPTDFIINSGVTVGESAALAAGISYLVPAGPAGWAIGAAFTIPLLAKGIAGLWHAHTEADKSGANVHQVAHKLADSAVSNSFNIGLTFGAGWAGANFGYKLADSHATLGDLSQKLAESKFNVGNWAGKLTDSNSSLRDFSPGDFSRSTRQTLIRYENTGLLKAKPALDFLTDKIPVLTSFRDPSVTAPHATDSSEAILNGGQPKNQLMSMALKDRPAGLVNNRVLQVSQTGQDFEGLQPINGAMHVHTVYSDGDGPPGPVLASIKKVGYVWAELSDHDHSKARLGEGSDDPRAKAEAGIPIIGSKPQESQTIRDAAAAITVPGEFFADVGEEVGVIGKIPAKPGPDGVISAHGANHTGIYGAKQYVLSDESAPPSRGVGNKIVNVARAVLGKPNRPAPIEVEGIQDGQFDQLATFLDAHPNPDNPVVAVLNHPRTSADFSAKTPLAQQGHDYGMSLFGDKPGAPIYTKWLAGWGDKYVRAIEIIKGGALEPNPIPTLPPQNFDLTSAQMMWDRGFHGGVAAGPDIHFQARIGEPPLATTLMAKSIDRAGVYEALDARRMSATSNFKQLTAYMTANDGKFMMGNIVDQAAIGGHITPEVHIGGAITPDANYTINIWSDPKTGDGKLAEIVQTKTVSGSDLAKANNTVTFDQIDHTLGNHSLYYAEVQRVDSSSPTYGDVVGTKNPKASTEVDHTDNGTFVTGTMASHLAEKGVDFVDYSTTPVSPETATALRTAPTDPYPERAFTSPIFVEPVTATHGILVTGMPGTTTQQILTPGIKAE